MTTLSACGCAPGSVIFLLQLMIHRCGRFIACSGECTRVLESQPSHIDLALHSSSILISANEGRHAERNDLKLSGAAGALVAWDLATGGERLRTIPLTDDEVAVENVECSAVNTANHLILCDNTIVCDLGRNVKSIAMPFPTRRLKSS